MDVLPLDLVPVQLFPYLKSTTSMSLIATIFGALLLALFFVSFFDNVVVEIFHANLRTSDLQFGFKSRHFTSMCTMVLKETITYYVTNNSSVYCSSWTPPKRSTAFTIVNYFVY